MFCEAGTLLGAGGGTEAIEGRVFQKDMGNWVLNREFLLGVWEGGYFKNKVWMEVLV